MITRTQELIIESDLQNLNKVVQLVEEISDEYNINNTYFGNILVSLTEAVKNAIIHGNKNDPSKKVVIKFFSSPSGLSFSVKDEGPGFNPDLTPNPVEVDNEGKKIPSGLYLIKALSDTAEFKENGSLLEFSFFISSINYQLSVERSKLLSNYFNVAEKKPQKSE